MYASQFQRQKNDLLNGEVRISLHALERFKQRNPDPCNPKNPEETIRKLLSFAFPIQFNKEHQIKRLLSNGFEETEYWYNDGWIFICSGGNSRTILTIERQGDRKFGKDLFRIDGQCENRRKSV